MKNKIFLMCLIALIAGGCKKADKLTQFYLDYHETVTIPASSGINLPFNIISPDVTTNSESSFEVHDTRKDLIQEIKLKTLMLTITSPSGSTFSFLKSVDLYISAPGLSEIKVASKENIPANVDNTLSLDINNIDLKEYIKSDKFTLRLNTVTDEIITSDQQIDIYSVFYVDAKLFKKR